MSPKRHQLLSSRDPKIAIFLHVFLHKRADCICSRCGTSSWSSSDVRIKLLLIISKNNRTKVLKYILCGSLKVFTQCYRVVTFSNILSLELKQKFRHITFNSDDDFNPANFNISACGWSGQGLSRERSTKTLAVMDSLIFLLSFRYCNQNLLLNRRCSHLSLYIYVECSRLCESHQ